MEVDTQTGGADDSVQVVLIGSTGSGKSCTGNTILGKKHFPSGASAKSMTLKCKSVTEIIHGRRVTVVDTPGWDCTELPKHEVEAEIREALKNLRGPFSFLLVIRIGAVESEDIDKIYGLREVLGPSFIDHTTILFSHSDNLEWKTFQEFLQEGGAQFQNLLKSCGHRLHSWNNRNRRSEEDVEKVLNALKMTEMKDQHQRSSSEEPVHEKRAEQEGNCVKGSDTETEMETEEAQNSKKPGKQVCSVMAADTQKRGAEDSVQDSAQRSEEPVQNNRVEQKGSCGKKPRETNTAAVDQNEGSVMAADTQMRGAEDSVQDSAKRSKEPVHKNKVEQKGNCGKGSREPDTAAVDAQNSKKPVRVLFLGMTKAGKTSSIKTLQAKCERTEDEGVYSYSPVGLLLQLIDSPGSDQNQKEIQELISKSKPHVIVIVMEVGRFGPAVKTTMQRLQNCLGPNATKHTMILFTRKDDLEGASIEKFIKENADLNRIVEANGRRIHALNNRDTSDHRQVEELLQKIADLYKENKGGFYKTERSCSLM